MKRILYWFISKIKIVKNDHPSKHRCNVDPNKFSTTFFAEIEKTNQIIIWNKTLDRQGKLSEMHNTGGITILVFKTYSRDIVIKSVQYWQKIEM